MGIENRGHRKRLMFFIDSLPPEEMFQYVPVSIALISINQSLTIWFSPKHFYALLHSLDFCFPLIIRSKCPHTTAGSRFSWRYFPSN